MCGITVCCFEVVKCVKLDNKVNKGTFFVTLILLDVQRPTVGSRGLLMAGCVWAGERSQTLAV